MSHVKPSVYRSTFKRTIGEIQSQWTTRQSDNRFSIGLLQRFADGGISFKTCQHIQDAPTKQQLRKYGSDQFKCGLAAARGPYCTHHWEITHITTPALTNPEE